MQEWSPKFRKILLLNMVRFNIAQLLGSVHMLKLTLTISFAFDGQYLAHFPLSQIVTAINQFQFVVSEMLQGLIYENQLFPVIP